MLLQSILEDSFEIVDQVLSNNIKMLHKSFFKKLQIFLRRRCLIISCHGQGG